MSDPDNKEKGSTYESLMKYQTAELEKLVDSTHKTLESVVLSDDYNFVMDVDRSPFYNYKSKLVGQMGALKHQYESFIS